MHEEQHSRIRQAFIRYFEQHGHQAVPSLRLIPQADPTFLFTNAGHEPV